MIVQIISKLMAISKWLDVGNSYVNFYIYIAIQYFFSLYVPLFLYFWNYFECYTLEGLDTSSFFFCNLWNIYFGYIYMKFYHRFYLGWTHLQYEIRRFMWEELSIIYYLLCFYFSINVVQLLLKSNYFFFLLKKYR